MLHYEAPLESLLRTLSKSLEGEIERQIRAQIALTAEHIVAAAAKDMASKLSGAIHSVREPRLGEIHVALNIDGVRQMVADCAKQDTKPT